MDQKKQARLTRFGMAGSVAAAFGASICCIGPIVAVMFGMTSLTGLAKYEPLRPIFGSITAVLLAIAFYGAYKAPTEAVCQPGVVCETAGVQRVQKLNRIAVWFATITAVIVFTFPTWSAWVLG